MLDMIPKRVIFYNPREDQYIDEFGDYIDNIGEILSYNDILQFEETQEDMIVYDIDAQPMELIYAWEDGVYFYHEEENRFTDSEGFQICYPLEILTANELFLLKHDREDLTIYRPRGRTFEVIFIPISDEL